MNHAFPSRPANNPLRRGRPPGEPELHALFQLISRPALLVDYQRHLVVLANIAYLNLTACAITEITGKPIQELMDGLPAAPLSADDTLEVALNRRGRPPLNVVAHARMLDSSGQWMVLVFDHPTQDHKTAISRFARLLDTLSEMQRIPHDEAFRVSIERALALICSSMDVTTVALYMAEPDQKQVVKLAEAGEQNLLPHSFPGSDLVRFALTGPGPATLLWKPGRRVQTELHRAARIQKLSYLASTAIVHQGLLVIAERTQEPSESLSILYEALGRQISAFIMQHTSMADLRRKAAENRCELAIRRSVEENAQEGILFLAPDLTVSELNPAAEWMLGYADWEVRGQPVENILIGPERLVPALEMACQGIPTHNLGNAMLHRRSGQAFPSHIQIVPVQPEGETLAIIIFFTDVSEHIEIRNRTQQLEQRAVLGEVTAVFAHEVRNPINNISTGLQLLSLKMPDDDPNQENIARLLHDCQRLNHLMESVLNFSRFVEHKFESVDLEQLLRRLLERWRPRMAKVNVEPFIQIEKDLPPVLADPRSIEQVFTNLISNAVEAMNSTGGTLAIRVSPHLPAGAAASEAPANQHAIPSSHQPAGVNLLQGRPQVEVTVSDSGPGIPDGIRERIFEPFVTTKQQGTGLGLSITKRIITAHHGSISVNSFPGGTVFQVILPVYQGESP